MADTIFIMGRPHCGSTILNCMLGSLPGTCAVGELHRIADIDNPERKCACGAVPLECEFWSRVKEIYVGRAGAEAWDNLLKAIPKCYTFKESAGMLVGLTRGGVLSTYAEGYNLLHECVAQAAGEQTVVDSSRNPFAALMLLRTNPDARVIHLVRNGDDSLYSKLHRIQSGRGFRWYRFYWQKVRWPGILLHLSGISWVIGNRIADSIRRRYPGRVLRIRYEDLSAEPEQTLRGIGMFLGKDVTGVIRKIAQQEPIQVGHAVGGNLLRSKGAFIFRPDTEKPLPSRYRRLFRLYARPTMRKFGYVSKPF